MLSKLEKRFYPILGAGLRQQTLLLAKECQSSESSPIHVKSKIKISSFLDRNKERRCFDDDIGRVAFRKGIQRE